MMTLEICATIKHLRPMPHYLSIDCEQRIFGFVDGDYPPEQEFRELESFRAALLSLIAEALLLPGGFEKDEPPYVSVEMKAGEHCHEPSAQFHFSLRKQSWDHEVCALLWGSGDDLAQFIFFNPSAALDFTKQLLDKKIGDWASEVTFARM